MKLEALQDIHSELRTSRAQLIAISPELERYTRAVHKKLNLSFDILTDVHLKTAEEYRLVFTFPDYLRELYKSFGSTLDRFHNETEYRADARAVCDRSARNYPCSRCERGLHDPS
jgi:peroxiredoxin